MICGLVRAIMVEGATLHHQEYDTTALFV